MKHLVAKIEAEVATKPSEVLGSEAHSTLPPIARSVLEALADQYRGHNNGSLTLTRYTALEYGISNPYALDESLRELEARGLIIETRKGTRPVGTSRARSAMFALTWWKIDPPIPSDPHHATPTIHPLDTWRSWRASKRGIHWTVKRRDRSKEKGREETRPFNKKPIDQDRLPVQPGDTTSGILGIQDTRQTTTALPDIERPALELVAADRIPQVVDQPPTLEKAPTPQAADSERAARYKELLKGVREKAAKYPRRPRRLGRPHLQDPFWPEIVLLLAEGTGMDEKSIAIFLGRLVSKYGWHRLEILVRECEALMLWGYGAMKYIELIRIPPPTSNDERADSAGGQEREDAPRITAP